MSAALQLAVHQAVTRHLQRVGSRNQHREAIRSTTLCSTTCSPYGTLSSGTPSVTMPPADETPGQTQKFQNRRYCHQQERHHESLPSSPLYPPGLQAAGPLEACLVLPIVREIVPPDVQEGSTRRFNLSRNFLRP